MAYNDKESKAVNDKQRMCWCDQPAVAFVHYEGIDIDRDERGGVIRPFQREADLCGVHMLELEQDVEQGEAHIFEQTDYVTGDVWREDAEEELWQRQRKLRVLS